MITKKARKLTLDNFKKYGTYANLIDPDTVFLGVNPVMFFRDMIQDDNQGTASYSNCRVEPREKTIDVSEYHNKANEVMFPIDGDIYIHVCHATADDNVDFDNFEVFFVPKGTLIVIRPGVWHHAPHAAGDTPVNTIIVLPERTYKNDCVVIEHDKFSFEGI